MSKANEVSDLTKAVGDQLHAMMQQSPSPVLLSQAYHLLAKWRASLIENTVIKRQGTTVNYGPFAGMEYSERATEGARVARLLGCYEASLTPVIESIIERGYELVIDIGCAEGYYAVGLALRMPKTHVLARDASPVAQKTCRTLAERNGVADRLTVGGEWAHDDFEICTTARSVVICDIEGAEDALFDPSKAPGLSDAIANRFLETHKVTKLNRRLDPEALPDWMENLSDLDRLTALWEWRSGPTPWLWIERRDKA